MDFVGLQPPRPDELELSIFGTGRGEAIVLHLGHGAWGLIDACRDPVTNDPLALAYLEHLGVVPEAVAFLLATHWHDDHVDGLAETLTACSAADFGMSAALIGIEFRAVTLAAQSIGVSGVEELRACFELIDAQPRRDGIRRAANRIVEDKRIWRNDDDSIVLTAIAPTNLAIQRSEQDIAHELLPTIQRRRALGRATPNQASVAALLTTPAGNILLGGDVEERGAGGSGWSAIVAQQRRFSRPRSDILKVPHHGSAGADLDEIWTELLHPQPISIVTPFASSRLPRRGDLYRLIERSEAIYLCGDGAEYPAALEPRVSRAAAGDGLTIASAGRSGHVRLRRGLDGDDEGWSILTAGAATRVTSDQLDPPETFSPGGAGRRRGRR